MGEVSRVLIALLAISCLAVQVQPEQATVQGGAGTDFEQVFSVINDQPRPAEYELRLHPFSEYLASAASISDERFYLLPQENENVQVRGTVPATLGPETHQLRYQVLEDQSVVAEFSVDIPIQGTPSLEPGLSVEAEDITRGSSLVTDVTLRNFGNVIAYYNLSLQVREAGREVGSLTYPQPVQVLPGEEEDLSLIYTDVLEPGDYQVRVQGVVNGREDVSDTAPVRVTLSTQERTISSGDDLLVELKRYGTQPRVQYAVTRSGAEVLSETLVVDQDSLTIPTATLEPGRYAVEISVTHAQGTDTQRFALIIEEQEAVSGWLALLLGVLALAAALLSPKARLYGRIAWLSLRVHLREKRLNRLIYRAHELESRYGS